MVKEHKKLRIDDKMNPIIIVNIEKQQQFTRRFTGIILLIIAVFWSVVAITSNWEIILRSGVFIFYFSGFLMVIEAKNAVCVVNAMRNRQGKTGWIGVINQEKIKDNVSAQMIRKIASKQFLQATIISIITSVFVIMIHIN